jgi:hypothetical protein
VTDGNNPADIGAVLATATRSAFHLEQRDTWQRFGAADTASYEGFLSTGMADAGFLNGWLATVREAAARGVEFRRLRIVSEPVTDYIRWEYALTPANLAAGEQVRWLPRSRCLDLLVVPVDFWVVDGRLVRFGLFTGNGGLAGEVTQEDPEIVKTVAGCFEDAWERGIPHSDYHI